MEKIPVLEPGRNNVGPGDRMQQVTMSQSAQRPPTHQDPSARHMSEAAKMNASDSGGNGMKITKRPRPPTETSESDSDAQDSSREPKKSCQTEQRALINSLQHLTFNMSLTLSKKELQRVNRMVLKEPYLTPAGGVEMLDFLGDVENARLERTYLELKNELVRQQWLEKRVKDIIKNNGWARKRFADLWHTSLELGRLLEDAENGGEEERASVQDAGDQEDIGEESSDDYFVDEKKQSLDVEAWVKDVAENDGAGDVDDEA